MSITKGKVDEYRPSASVIIAARKPATTETNNNYDYEILMFERSRATAYLPNHCVFPGGVFEQTTDDSPEWLKYFREFGITDEHLKPLQATGVHADHRPEFLKNGKNMPRDISLRLTALRETFEEVGIFACKHRDAFNGSAIVHNECDGSCAQINRTLWQKRVHDNSAEFLQMCKSLNVVPDLWSLSEWSLWRSPATSRKRYDTVYYFLALPHKPQLLLEEIEVERELWATPSVLLEQFEKRRIWLPPTQFYELSRLTNARRWLPLRQFAVEWPQRRSTLLWLVYYRCEGLLIGTLPGDDLYPNDPNEQNVTIEVQTTLEEFQRQALRRHRLLLRDVHDMQIELTIPPIDRHLSPLIHADLAKSKL